MYHSITIDDKNTWDDWHLIAKTRPFFNPPTQKTKYIDVPGSSGQIDLSNALTGYPVFNNREGSIDFTILNIEDVDPDYEYKYPRWIDLYTEIVNYLNGKTHKIFLEDEPEYYYEGVLSVTGYKPGDSASNTRGVLTISYSLNPYKMKKLTGVDTWPWDTFNFINGSIEDTGLSDIVLTAYPPNNVIEREYHMPSSGATSSSVSIEVTGQDVGDTFNVPDQSTIWIVKSNVKMEYKNDDLDIFKTKDLKIGTNTIVDCPFVGDFSITFYCPDLGFTNHGIVEESSGGGGEEAAGGEEEEPIEENDPVIEEHTGPQETDYTLDWTIKINVDKVGIL